MCRCKAEVQRFSLVLIGFRVQGLPHLDFALGDEFAGQLHCSIGAQNIRLLGQEISQRTSLPLYLPSSNSDPSDFFAGHANSACYYCTAKLSVFKCQEREGREEICSNFRGSGCRWSTMDYYPVAAFFQFYVNIGLNCR